MRPVIFPRLSRIRLAYVVVVLVFIFIIVEETGYIELGTSLRNFDINKATHKIQKGYNKIYSLLHGVLTEKYDEYFDVNIPEFNTTSNWSNLFPKSSHTFDDRILEQLSYKPPGNTSRGFRLIYIPGVDLSLPEGTTGILQKTFLDKCKVTECLLSQSRLDIHDADIVVLTYHHSGDYRSEYKSLKEKPRRPGQIWAMLTIESPDNTGSDLFDGNDFNWTITTSPSSTIPLLHGKIYPIKPGVTTLLQTRNYASGKTGKVVWIVNNCVTPNKRMTYVNELKRHIDIDIFGNCGKRLGVCEKLIRSTEKETCLRNTINKYKFYLSFENSNCNTYVTEAFFEQGLSNDVVPVVMGALPEYYRYISPPDSFIHVEDFKNARDLARYLHTVDQNEKLYNDFFRWKGAWRFMPFGNVFCRMCAMLHIPNKGSVVTNIKKWKESEQCREPILPWVFYDYGGPQP